MKVGSQRCETSTIVILGEQIRKRMQANAPLQNILPLRICERFRDNSLTFAQPDYHIQPKH